MNIKNIKSIFISYSHKDKVWKERLARQLEVLERQGRYKVWHDRKIELGTDWYPEIQVALSQADAIIMLISSNFLTSDFILKNEIPPILERREKEKIVVIPVFTGHCAWSEVDWLKRIQGVPEDGRPLSGHSDSSIDEILAGLAKRLCGEPDDDSPIPPDERKDHELLSPLPPRKVELIGRKDELSRLENQLKQTDRALLVNGLGGIGKSEVCKRFFYDHYRQYRYAAWVDVVGALDESLVVSLGLGFERAGLVNPNPDDTMELRFAAIMDALSFMKEDFLLVLDNLENPDDDNLDGPAQRHGCQRPGRYAQGKRL